MLLASLILAASAAAVLPGQSAPAGTSPTTQPDPSPLQQRQLCFPASAPAPKTFTRGNIVIWTAAGLDGDALLAHLAEVEKQLQSILPAAAAPAQPARSASPRPVALAVYASPKDYHALWQRVGDYYGGAFPPVATQGYSYRVFCATSYAPPEKFAARKPVVCHEFAHVWLYQNRGLRNDGNWLTEGLGTAVQMKFFPASADRNEFARWLEAGRMLPLKRLMDLDRIATKDYWQAGTLAELLIRQYGDKLPGVVAAFNRGASAHAIVTDVLETDFAALEKQWADYVRAAQEAK